jgi:hypothetical protein
MFGVNTQRVTMTQDKVLEYLAIYGEKISAEIKLNGLDSKKRTGMLAKLVNSNKVTRRQVPHGSKMVWCYRAANSGPIEPDYSYTLRNLPRNQDDGHG